MKRSMADVWFSRAVRMAADWTCERCGAVHQEGSLGLHCSHIFSRRHRTIRWAPENAVAHCFTCHQWYGGNPVDSSVWAWQYLGEGRLELIKEKRDSGVKVPSSEEKEIAAHYKAECDRIQALRDQGVTGQIEVRGYQ